jgi:hypothetical protein
VVVLSPPIPQPLNWVNTKRVARKTLTDLVASPDFLAIKPPSQLYLSPAINTLEITPVSRNKLHPGKSSNFVEGQEVAKKRGGFFTHPDVP